MNVKKDGIRQARLNMAAPLPSGTQGTEGKLLPLKEETRVGRTSGMMNKGCCFRLAAWLALSGLPGAGMAEMLPAEEVLPAAQAYARDIALNTSPIAIAVAKAQVAYRDMDNKDNVDFKRVIAALGYDYALSKRTAVYAMTGWSQ